MGLDKLKGNAHRSLLSGNWTLPIIIFGAALALLVLGDNGRDWLRFERSEIAAGEWWRLLSGHFVHLGPSHFLLNMAGLGFVWYLLGKALRGPQWAIVFAFAVGLVDLGFWFLNPELQWYVGLSGVLHGLLVAGLIILAGRDRKDLLAVAVLVAVKIAWEQTMGAVPGSAQSSGGPVIVDAHLYGAIAGIIAGTVARIRVRRAAPI